MTETVRRLRRKTLTDKMVEGLPKKAKRYTYADPEQRGHYVRVMPAGANVFAAVARDPYGKQVWATIGSADVTGIEAARELARTAIRRIKEGKPAFEPPPVKPDTVEDVARNWFERYVEKNKLRTAVEIKRITETHILPAWANRPFADIRRGDIAKLLDHVEDRHGAWTADVVLTVLRQIASWFATRHDDYVPPFVKNMKRVPAQARKRARVLDDDELAYVWRAAEESDTYGALIRMLLLTAQRREKVRDMKWSDLDGDVWCIATASREKGNAGSLVLPAQAMAIINSQPRFGSNPYVFPANRGLGAIRGFAQRKADFDKKLPPMPRWTLHDLRRTARSLMSRAAVLSEHAEKVLGHAVRGVEGTYDRHDYTHEKGIALTKLAALIETIVNPSPDNVVHIRPAKKS